MKSLKAKRRIIGLDIGAKEIKLVEGDVALSVPLPENAVLDGVIVDTKKVAGVIKNLFSAGGLSAKDVITALSGKAVLLRLSNVPSMGAEATKEAIRDEAANYMAFAGSEVCTDFYPLEEIRVAGNKEQKVLSVAARKEVIDSYVETIKLAGLNLCAIDAAPLILARAVCGKESLSDGIVILAAVEDNSAALFIFNDGKMHYLHHVDAPNELEAEMAAIMAYCKDEFGESAGIKKIISTDFKDISIAQGLTLRETKQAEFPVKINLLPLAEIKSKEFDRQFALFTKAFGLLMTVLLFYFFFLRVQTGVTLRNIAAIQEALNKPNPILNELLDIERAAKIYQLEMDEQEKIILAAKGKDAGKILQEIKRIIPKNAYLSNLNINDKDAVTFTGEAVVQDAVFDFVRSLKGSRFFKDVVLEKSKAKEGTGGAHTYFVIKCRL